MGHGIKHLLSGEARKQAEAGIKDYSDVIDEWNVPEHQRERFLAEQWMQSWIGYTLFWIGAIYLVFVARGFVLGTWPYRSVGYGLFYGSIYTFGTLTYGLIEGWQWAVVKDKRWRTFWEFLNE